MPAFEFKKPCYTIKETGDILSVSRSTIVRLVNDGALVQFHLGPNSVRITADSIEAHLSKQMLSSQMSS